ncbi:unnamed protein product, partial [Prunus brigantina]
GQPIFLRVTQDCINPYDLLWGLLSGIAILDLLNGLLCHELRAIAFSYELFEVHLPRLAIGIVMPMCSMEGPILVGTSLVRISLQSKLLCCDSIIVPECLVFHTRKDLCQSLAGINSQLEIQVVLNW